MSVDYNCGIMVGLSYVKAVSRFLEEDIDRLLDDGEISSASPYYDSCRKEWTIGLWVQDVNPIDAKVLDTKIEKIKEQLRDLIGDDVEYKVYLTMNVT